MNETSRESGMTTKTDLDPSLEPKLRQLLEQDKIFKVRGLLVGDLARQLRVRTRTVSILMREVYGMDFRSAINHFRVYHALKKIEEGYLDDFTIESLGESCGFNSRTTFFNAFKKEFGTGPGGYWKDYQDN